MSFRLLGAGSVLQDEMIAKALVDHPEEVEVRSVEGQHVIVLELCVHPEDLGKVIGRHGRTAEALRTIFGAAGMKLQKHVMVEILENQFFFRLTVKP